MVCATLTGVIKYLPFPSRFVRCASNLASASIRDVHLCNMPPSLYLVWHASRQVRAKLGQVPFNHVTSAASITPIKPPRTEKRRASVMVMLIQVLILLTSVEITGAFVFCATSVFSGFLQQAISLVVVANAAANPIVYSFQNIDIRKKPRKLLTRSRRLVYISYKIDLIAFNKRVSITSTNGNH